VELSIKKFCSVVKKIRLAVLFPSIIIINIGSQGERGQHRRPAPSAKTVRTVYRKNKLSFRSSNQYMGSKQIFSDL
jgi:hypothetical protein